ncbi:uncharacterized protein LODBEIA_P24360 [Lodderomyces beijingensis]|uniref:Uncharacterized protein n=1 Tax=Lodderomyces beijingensis TaxID=1775926 RepID=A0ABP0ZLG3_9ASCO
MRFAQIVTAAFCLATSLVSAQAPAPTPQGEVLELKHELDDYVETYFDTFEIDTYYNAIDLLHISSQKLEKRADGNNSRGEYYPAISSALEMVNSSGVLWTLLDAVADHPNRVEVLTNLTSRLLGGANFTISVADLIGTLGVAGGMGNSSAPSQSALNTTELLAVVENSGLVKSLLDGILLDQSFRPRLVDLIDRLVLSQRDLLRYIFQDLLAKRDLILRREDLGELVKRQDEFNGTLESFILNAANSVLGSQIFTNVAESLLNALNDTGFAVYTVKRFLSSDAYVNMTAALVSAVVDSGAIQISFEGVNTTAILESVLSDPEGIAALIGGLLSGGSSNAVSNILSGTSISQYMTAIQEILQDLERKGTFAELNSYIWGTTTTTATVAATATNTAQRIAVTAAHTTSSSRSASASGANRDQANSASGVTSSLNWLKPMIYTQVAIIAGLVFF